MFKIYDGRDQFYQWDIDRKLIVEDATITQVHFCNRTDNCSLVCEVYEENGLRIVDVPNILLQDVWRINVYGYDTNYTKHSDWFNVVKRTKPADYVYTETETLNFNTLLERIEGVEEGVGQAVEDYLAEHDIKVDLTDYYTKEEVEELIPTIDGLATISYVDEKISSVKVDVDLSDYYTKDQVDDKFSTVEVDLSDYYTKDQVDDKLANIPTGGGAGVYVGAEEPDDPAVNVWIDLDGDGEDLVAAEGGAY